MIGIISDIHGNYEALCSVLAALDKSFVQRVICLGDIVGYYSQVNECCTILRERSIFSLLGNHDWYLISEKRCPRSKSANQCLDYQRSIISYDHLSWLSSLQSSTTIEGIRIVHGGWNDPLEEYLRPSTTYFHSLSGTQFASGHTHIPCIWHVGKKIYCNPGSVGQPRDGDPRASFAIWDGKKFKLYRVSYDIQKTQKAMATAGFSSYFYKNLTYGVQIGGNISR